MGSIYTEQLSHLLQSTGKSSSAKLALTKIQSEISSRLATSSSSKDFFVEVCRMLTQIKGVANAEARMQCLLDCGRYFYLNELTVEAFSAARTMERIAVRTGAKDWERKANTLLGAIASDAGDVATAVEYLSAGLALAHELQDAEAEVNTLNNLAVTLNYGGLYREAMLCLERMVVIASSRPELNSVKTTALTNLSQNYLSLGHPEAAVKAIVEALAASGEPTDAVATANRVIREFTYFEIAIELEQMSLARERAKKVISYAQRSGTPRSKCMASIAKANCEIHDGRPEKGVAMLESALSEAKEFASKQAVLIALVKACDHAELPERALAFLDELITLFRSLRQKGLAALVHADLSTKPSQVVKEEIDLRQLTFRQATLRARVAERKALNAQLEILERFAVTADLREEMSGEHGLRVGRLAALVAGRLGWTKDAIYSLELGARLHDIGKIGVPDRIVLKSQELRDSERHFICAHTTLGAELLGKSGLAHLRIAAEIARCHHEWWNGDGYPAGLSGTRIPLHARIVALADVFDALTHGRPYASPWSTEQALVELRNRRGTQFDPELTDVFLALIDELRIVHSDLDSFLSEGNQASSFAAARRKIHRILSAERGQLGLVAKSVA